MRTLATMRRDEVAFTMALTLPGCEIERFSHEMVIESFQALMRRLSAKKAFAGVSGFWKREPQQRGALHYHLLLYGIEDASVRSQLHAWLVRQWTSFFAPSLNDQEKEHHRWWHARPENMQQVSDFHSYFAKYLGKTEDANGAAFPGRWWGSFNKRKLPVSPTSEVKLSHRETVLLQRLAQKRRQVLIDRAHHIRVTRALEKAGAGILALSEWQLHRLRCGYDLKGYRNPPTAGAILRCYKELCMAAGLRPGRTRLQGRRSGKIILCGQAAPSFAVRALDYAGRSMRTPDQQNPAGAPPVPAGAHDCSSLMGRPRSNASAPAFFLSRIPVDCFP